MLPRDVPTIIILFGLVVSMSAIFIGDLGYYNPESNISSGDWNTTYNKINNVYESTKNMQDSVRPEQSGVDFLITGTQTVINTVLNSFSLVSSILKSGLEDVGLPSSVANPLSWGLFSIFIITVVFSIISAVLKQRI